jgi:hypothetical protein
MEIWGNRGDRFAGRVSFQVWISECGVRNRIYTEVTESTEVTEKRSRPARKRQAGKAELPHSKLGQGVAVVGGVAAGGVVFELALDVGEHAAGAEAEEIGF